MRLINEANLRISNELQSVLFCQELNRSLLSNSHPGGTDNFIAIAMHLPSRVYVINANGYDATQ